MKAMAYIMYHMHSFNTATGEQRKLNPTSTYWKDVPYIGIYDYYPIRDSA